MEYYWVYVKRDDDVRYQNRKPKNKFSVRETGEEAGAYHMGGAHRIHYLDLLDKEGNVIRQCDFESWCGFDRGPKLHSLIRNLIINGMGGKYAR